MVGHQTPDPEKKREMESVTTSPQAIHTTSTQLMKQEPSSGRDDLKRKAEPSAYDEKIQGSSAAELDLTEYDLKAHSLLCAELLNGEGVDRLPQETDAELVSRLWASWSDCKILNAKANLSRSKIRHYILDSS